MGYSPEMLALFNPYQVEEKYGGKAPNLTKFWPPTVPDTSFSSDGKPIKLSSNKDSYSKYKPTEVIIEAEAPEEEQDPISQNDACVLSRANSLEISVDRSVLPLDDHSGEVYARSDDENQQENLVDFEAVAPFTRQKTRNPLFYSSSIKCSEEFQRKLTIRTLNLEKKRSNIVDSDSSVDFDPDPDPESMNNIMSSTTVKKQEEICSLENKEIEMHDQKRNCSCGQVECSIFRSSCIMF